MSKKRVQLLKAHLEKFFPEVVGVSFYPNHRSKYVHMGLDIPLYSTKDYPDFIEEINTFLAKNFGSRFELVYPQIALTVKWKFDYIILRKLKKNKNNGK